MIFIAYWKVLVLNFSEVKGSCFKLFGDGKYDLFWAKKLMERWYLLITKKFLLWTFRWWEIRSFSQRKSWRKDDIYLVFLSFPWYSRTWEMWFSVQWWFNSERIAVKAIMIMPSLLLRKPSKESESKNHLNVEQNFGNLGTC